MAISQIGTNAIASSAVTNAKVAAGSQYYSFKNRIINGQMQIDQRNSGASLTNNTGIQYPVDRFLVYGNGVASKFTMQQNQGSVTPPVGFTNYLGFTSSAATTVASGDIYEVLQRIEGFNTADLGWGTANAAAVTLSFKVYSSLTGTFGGAIQNSASTRSYPFSYTISSANTWTSISVTIPGDTSGTWIGATNGIGMQVIWGLGVGTTYSGTAGAWAGTAYYSVTGATSMVATNGATFYITGVQLETGSTATSFDYRPYGTELALCQRYYQKFSGALTTNAAYCCGNGFNVSDVRFMMPLLVTMRAVPSTVTLSAANTFFVQGGNGNITPTGNNFLNATPYNIFFEFTGTSLYAQGYGYTLLDGNGTSSIQVSAEL